MGMGSECGTQGSGVSSLMNHYLPIHLILYADVINH